ncbi:MAG: hypothetical protein AAGJ79_03775 [Verrucomicrobiota bacterium]
MMNKAPVSKNRGRIGLLAIVLTSILALVLPAHAQLAASGTPGDVAVYDLDLGGIDNSLRPMIAATTSAGPAIPAFVHNFDTTLIDPLMDSQELAGDGSFNLTAGHHIMIYNTEFDSAGDRAGVDNYVTIDGSITPYAASAAFARDGDDDDLISIGGTILNVAQGANVKIETLRTDVQADQISARSIRLDNASVQFVKLDDVNLNFARLRLDADAPILPANNSGPNNIPYTFQDELDTVAFEHDTSTANTDITLKDTGFYLVFSNAGFFITNQQGQRQAVSQRILLNGSPVDGGSSTVYLRNSGNADTAGGQVRNGAASIATLVEVTSANSILSVQVLRDQANNSTAIINLESERTGLAIAKLPAYGSYINLFSAPTETDPSGGDIDFSLSPNVSNSSFTYDKDFGFPEEVTINEAGNYLMLSSQYGTAQANAQRSTIQHVIENGGAAYSYGFGGIYNRAENVGVTGGNGKAISSGTWAGVVASNSTSDVITVQSNQRGGAAGTITAQVALQGINIDSISSIPADPIISVNAPLNILVSSTGNVISGASNLQTFDSNTASTATLEYTITLAPFDAIIRRSGTQLFDLDTFTQADLDAGIITVDAPVFAVNDNFEFEVNDTSNGGETPATGVFTINIGEATLLTADVLIGLNEDIIGSENNLSGGQLTLLDNDMGSGLSVFSIDTVSANGAAVELVNPEGRFNYNPTGTAVFQQLALGESLDDSFTYTVVDFAGNFSTTIVTGTVAGTNDLPVAGADSLALSDLDESGILNLLANDSDVDNGAVLIVGNIGTTAADTPVPVTFTSTNGAEVTVSADGTFLYDISKTTTFFNLADGASLSESFVYEVIDDLGASVTTTINVAVGGAPGASTDLAIVNATAIADACDPPVTVDYLANDFVSGSTAGVLSVDNALAIEFDAATTTNTATTWFNTGVTATQGTPNLAVLLGTLNNAPANAPPGVTAVYEFTGGAAASNDSGVAFDDIGDDAAWGGGGNGAPGGNLNEGDATIEIVFRPSDQNGSEVLWETGGGTTGSSIVLVGNQVVATFSDANDFAVQTAATLPAGAVANGEFVHLILLVDQDGNAGSHLRLYLNNTISGVSAGTQSNLLGTGATNQLNNWSGTDNGGLGIDSGAIGGDPQLAAGGLIDVNTAIDYAGEIAVYRIYDNLLDDGEIVSSFEAIFGSSAPAVLADLVEIGNVSTTLLTPGVSQIALASGALLDFDGTTVDYIPNNALVELTTGGFVNADNIGIGLEAIDRIPYQIDTAVNSIANILVRIKGTNANPQISITAPNPDVNEGSITPNAFELSSSFAVGAPVDVTLEFTGTALAGADFIASTTISFSGTSASVSVNAINDSLFEGAEDLTATIVAVASGAVIGGPNAATITINDAQTEPEISIGGGGSITEGDEATLTVTATVASDEDITLDLAYSGVALNGFDAFVENSITLPAGSTSVNIPFLTADDGFTEGTESYSLQMTGPNIGTVDTSVASGDISDGSGSHVFFATFDNAGLTVDPNVPFDDTLTTGINASAAANAGTEIGTWANVFGGGTTIANAPNGVVFEADDVKGTLGLEYDGQAAGLGSVPKATILGPDVDQLLRQDRPGNAEQTINSLGTEFAQVTAEFADAIDISGSNTGFISFDINNRRTTDGVTKNSELWALDTEGQIVLRLIISGDNNPNNVIGDEQLIAATDTLAVDTNEVVPTNWIPLGNPNTLPNSAGDNDEEESDLNRVSIIMNSTDYAISYDDDDIEGEATYLATNLPYVGAGRQIQKFVFAVKANDGNNDNNGHDIDDVIAVGVDANAKPSITLDGSDLADGVTTALTGLTQAGGTGILAGETITFNSANSNELQIDDLDDGGAANLTTRLQVNGLTGSTVVVTLSGSASISAGANGTADLTIQGTEADINATLAGGVVVTGGNASGAASLQITVDDAGNTGPGGALDCTHSFSFVVFANPTVTINQAASQADPVAAEAGGVVFTVVFSEDVDGFDDGSTDVDLSGSTAGGTLTAVIAEVAPNDGTTYEVTVTGFNTSGTIVATVPQGAAVRAGTADQNDASSSDDNEVTVTVNESPTVTGLPQTIDYDATITAVDIGDIIVSDVNEFLDSIICVDNTTSLFVNFPVDDTTMNFAVADPSDALGFSMEIVFTPSPDDVAAPDTGFNDRVLMEIGGSSNGAGLFLVNGIPYFASKMNSTFAQSSTAALGEFDLDWDNTAVPGDEMVLFPLSSGPVAPGGENSVSLIFTRDSATYSVNGAPEQTVNLINRGSNGNWGGDNSVSIGLNGGGIGGAAAAGGGSLVTAPSNLTGTVTSAKMWNISDSSVTIKTGLLEEEITASLTIQGWADSTNGTLSADSGNGETFSGGVWSITDTRSKVQLALLDLVFNVGGATADPTIIDVSVEDGDEDVSPPITGTITLNVNAPTNTELQDWRFQFFGTTDNTGDAANTADPNNNGLSNIIEFGLGLDPTAISGGPLAESGGTITSLGAPIVVIDGAGAGLHTLRYTARADEGTIANLTVTPQASNGDPTTISSWSDLASGAPIATGNFNGIDVEMFEVTLPGQPGSVVDQARVQITYTGLE